jgi:O-antigen ligase
LFVISIPVLIILVLGLIFSFTRAAWLSVAVSLAFSLFFVFRVRFYSLIIFLLAIVSIALINQDEIIYRLSLNKQNSAEGIEQHLESISNINNDQSNLERVNRWVAAINMSKDKPIFGFGPGTYPFKYAVYQDPDFETEITTHFGDQGHAHSEYLNPLAESGWLGMLSWMAILFFVFQTGFKLVYNATDIKVKVFAAAILLGLVTYLAHGVVNGYSDQDKIAVLLWGSFAIITALDIYHVEGEDKLHKLELDLEE